MVVQSFGTLQSLAHQQTTWSSYTTGGGATGFYGGHPQSYKFIYASQPNVRTCVDFLARNIAQISLHVFRRKSDTDRERLADHDLAHWLAAPNPSTRRYRLFESLIGDLGIYFNAYWVKVRYLDPDTGRKAIGLVRLPPDEVVVEGALMPTDFVWTPWGTGQRKTFAPSEIVFFNGYNPLNSLIGLSPLETLRRILAEEAAAGMHREQFWLNAARHEGVIERTKDAPDWTPDQVNEFRRQWAEFATGGTRVGGTPVLPKGMTLKSSSFSAKDSEYLAGRKLTREECAAAYHIPLPMVGILEHATFSNIKEQHKNLYQDTLGPWLEMIQEEIEGQLLVEAEDQDNVYVEFNIAEKLKGSFEEQASSLATLIGRPIMTANEGRARVNLPRVDDPTADQLAAQQGGPATVPPTDAPPNDAVLPADDTADARAAETIIRHVWDRQSSHLSKLTPEARAAAFDHARWTRELTLDLTPLLGRAARVLATRINDVTYALLRDGKPPFRPERRPLSLPRDPEVS